MKSVRRAGCPGSDPASEQSQRIVFNAAQIVVIDDDAVDPAVAGQRACLGFDLLRGEYPAHGAQGRILIHLLQISAELLDPVDLAATLDFDGAGSARLILAHHADRT